MSNKVIIDGVDVSGCEHYWNTHNLELCKINFDNNYYSNGLPLAEKCSFKDCYYKQMKRLEQENKKLKELLETRCYNEVEFENKKLKEKLKKIKEFVTPLYCNNPLDCWMNKDEGTGDIYGCEGDDYKGCPNGFASCILKIIEGAEDE